MTTPDICSLLLQVMLSQTALVHHPCVVPHDVSKEDEDVVPDTPVEMSDDEIDDGDEPLPLPMTVEDVDLDGLPVSPVLKPMDDCLLPMDDDFVL